MKISTIEKNQAPYWLIRSNGIETFYPKSMSSKEAITIAGKLHVKKQRMSSL